MREDKEYREQRMREEKAFNKVYLPRGGLEAELNLGEEKLVYADWRKYGK